jgi:Tfp pilus assembly protein PilF
VNEAQMIQQNLQLAIQFHQAGDLAKAGALYRQILQQMPRHPDVLHLLGLVSHQSGQHDIAVDLIRKAISITGGNPGYFSNLGLALEALNRLDEAASAYRKALSLKPDFAQALLNLCQLLGRRTDISPELLDCSMQLGSRFLSQGNLPAAEICYRDVLDQDETNSHALKALTKIYNKAGLRTTPPASDRDSRQDTVAGPCYLLIKSWGCGFWSDVGSVLGALLLAEVTDRIPVIHWGSNSLFGDGSGRDAFTHYFEPASEISLNNMEKVNSSEYFPPKWNQGNLLQEDLNKWQGSYSRMPPYSFIDRKETVAVCDFFVNVVDVMPWIPVHHPMHGKSALDVFHWLIQKYLKPRLSVVEQVEEFYRSHLADHPFVSIHLRGSDKAREAKDLAIINQSSIHRLEDLDPSWKIFLLTDDENWLRVVNERFGPRVITTSCTRTNSTQGVHFLATGSNRIRVGREVLIDTYVALRANQFIGNGWSNVSGMIAVMKNWAADDCILYGVHRLLRRNLTVYALGM